MFRKLALSLLSLAVLVIPNTAFAAIAFDNSTLGAFSVGTSRTISHTVNSATNGIVIISCWDAAGLDNITSASWNGAAATKIKSQLGTAIPEASVSVWYAFATTTVTGNAVCTSGAADNIAIVAASYTGVKQSGQPDASSSTVQVAANVSYTGTVTTVATNAWVGMAAVSTGAQPTATTGIMRQAGASGEGYGDSNAAVSPGVNTLTHHSSAGSQWVGVTFSLAPAVTAAATTASLTPVPINGGVSDSGGGMGI